MRKKEERKKHDKLALRQAQDRLATSRYFSGTGSGHCHFCLLPLKTDTKTNVAMAWRDFLLTTDDEYRFTCGGDFTLTRSQSSYQFLILALHYSDK